MEKKMKISVTDDTFEQEVIKNEVPALVLVDFWANWCGPCKMIAPIVDNIAEKYVDSVKVVTLDVDTNPKTCTEHKIMGIPTLLFFKNGKVIDQIVGYTSQEDVEDTVEKLI
jgi:thioredoxin 1